MLLPREADRLRHFAVADRQSGCVPPLEDTERDRGNSRRHDRIAERVWRVRRNRHDLPELERAAHVVPAFGLNDDDCRLGYGQRDSGREPAATAGNRDPRRRAPQLLDDVQPGTALPRDDRRVVEAGDDGRAGLSRYPRGNGLATLVSPVVEDDLRAFRASAFNFHAWRIGRHDDDRANPEPPRRDRDAARMIAGRERDDTPLTLIWRELEQPVGRTAELERAAGLKALALEPDACARDLAFDQRSALDQPVDSLSGGNDVIVVDQLRFHIQHQIGPPRHCGIGRSPSATSTAARANSRVESSTGSGDTSAVISKGISVQTSATASQPRALSFSMMAT